MRVSRQQAEANRQRVIDTASRLFREHGYDGIGLKDLMAAAGLTQGGFYKQFASKADLAAQATERAVQTSAARWAEVAADNPDRPLQALAGFYLSAAHRDARDRGCPLAALGSDAPRHAPAVQTAFATGIDACLDVLDVALGGRPDDPPSPLALTTLATMVGALVLARMRGPGAPSDALLAAAVQQLERIAQDSPRQP